MAYDQHRSGSIICLGRYQLAFGTNGSKWPNATIPFEIDAGDFPIGSSDRTAIEQAIAEWNENTVVRFVPRGNEADYVVFTDVGTSCASNVGRIGGPQTLSCDLEGNFSAGNLMHELGHTAGLFHEQQRPDRGSFVTISSNVDGGNCAILQDGRLLTDYDCDSIMHYPPSGCGGITPRAGGCSGIGQRNRLSGRDVWGASLLYDVTPRTVVVWDDDSSGDGASQIHASAFAENGARCFGPLSINRRAKGQQQTPALGVAGNRDMIFVYADDRDRNTFFQIRMRGFAQNGRQRFSDRVVNEQSAGQQIAPDVAVTNDGRFVVVWQDDTDKNQVFQIKVRGFEANGTERFSQRTVNTRAKGQQTAPRVAIAPDGFFVVVWEDDADRNGFKNVRMRGFNHDGTERWAERRVNVDASGQQRRPRIAMGPFGDFAIVWEDDRDNNKVYQIRMRAFNSDGNEKFAEKTVNVGARGQQLEPDVAVDDVFRPVVVWADDQDGNGAFQIRMRGFESDGRQRFGERTVNTDAAGQQRRPAIGMEANGRFTVAWEDDPNKDEKADVLARGFSADGVQLFSTRHVSNIPGGHKGLPRVAAPAMSVWDVVNPF
jgi:hypothetical protein